MTIIAKITMLLYNRAETSLCAANTNQFEMLTGLMQEVIQSNEPRASTSGDAGTAEPAMTLEQFKEQLKELEKGLRSLPATAQVLLSPLPPLPHISP